MLKFNGMDRTGAKIDVNVAELCPKASIIDLDNSCLMELDKDHLNRVSGTIYFVSNLNSGLLYKISRSERIPHAGSYW